MNEPQKPATNPKLKEAAAAVRANNTPETLNLLINEMTRSMMLAPAKIDFGGQAPKPDANGRVQMPKGTKINFLMLNTKEGEPYFMAFTDWQELQKWTKDTKQQTMMLRFDDYARMLEQNDKAAGFVLNPYGDNLRFPRGMVESIKKQHDAAVKAAKIQQEHRIKPGDKITIVEPTMYPDELVDPICEVLEKHKTIGAAFLQVMIVNETDKSYLLVLDGPKEDAVFSAVALAAKPYLSKSEKKMDLNITVSASPLGQQGMRGSEAFYIKGQGRIFDEDEED